MLIYNWKDRKEIEDGCGGKIFKIIGIDDKIINNIEMAMCIFLPLESSRSHYHQNIEEIYFILYGKAIVSINDIEYEVNSQDTIVIPKGTKHFIKNQDEKCNLEFLSINSPEWFQEDMIYTD